MGGAWVVSVVVAVMVAVALIVLFADDALVQTSECSGDLVLLPVGKLLVPVRFNSDACPSSITG